MTVLRDRHRRGGHVDGTRPAAVPSVRAASGDRGTDLAVRVHDLRMAYGSHEVLQGVDFTVGRGEVVALLGPNGAGKSTTVEILEGFRARSSGDVEVLGVDPAHASEAWRARIGIVLQSWRDHGRWTVHELLHHFARHYERYSEPGKPRPHDVRSVIEQVGLTEKADTVLQSLSGGQRRRVDVAIGIIGNPDLLFLDEPTAGFDPQARRDFHELVRTQARRDDTTVLLTTHDLHEAENLADRILILDGGRIVADGSPAALAEQVASTTRVEWTEGGRRHVREVADSTAFIRELLAEGDRDVSGVDVHRTGLEDVYLSMVRRSTTGPQPQTDAREGGRR